MNMDALSSALWWLTFAVPAAIVVTVAIYLLSSGRSTFGPQGANAGARPGATELRRYWKPIVGGIFGLMIVGAVIWAFPDRFHLQRFAKVGLGAFYFALMLAGMTAQYMFNLKKPSDFDLWEFVRPLWISVMVFAFFWLTLKPEDGITFALGAGSFQNGFFWKVIFEGLQQKVKKS